MFKKHMLAQNICVLQGGVNSVILIENDEALLINAPMSIPSNLFKGTNVKSISKILFTHHRRELADGLPAILKDHQPHIGVPEKEKELFEEPMAYWLCSDCRWELLMHDHTPYHVTHINHIDADECFSDGDTISWHGWTITVLETPGYTDGSVSYIAEKDNTKYAFTGDLIYDAGKIYDLYSLQHGNTRNDHTVGDYHGFLGSLDTLKNSLRKVINTNPDMLIPCHGALMENPQQDVAKLINNLDLLYRKYTQVSALRWYFPKYFQKFASDPQALPFAKEIELPDCVRVVEGTTWLLISETKRAILIDPASQKALTEVEAMLKAGDITGIDYIWLTHYHFDHVEFAQKAKELFDAPVTTDEILAKVVEMPEHYFLACLKNDPVDVDYHRNHGETWQWENFILTSFHFPGQTYYHSGLLAVNDSGKRYFFTGDSFSPSGIDDYCTWNRNWLGAGIGHRKCIDILQQLKPNVLFNQHISKGFNFTEKAYKHMVTNLIEREDLLKEILPWEHPNFGLDEYWLHAFPYEQTLSAGSHGRIKLNVFNHSSQVIPVGIKLKSTDQIKFDCEQLKGNIIPKHESSFRFLFSIPGNTPPGKYIIPINISWHEKDIGSFREFIVNIE